METEEITDEQSERLNSMQITAIIMLLVIVMFIGYCIYNIEFIKMKPLEYCGQILNNSNCVCYKDLLKGG